MQIRNKDCIVTALKENNRIAELHIQNVQKQEMIGSIYVGKVEKIQENIHAAFIRTGSAGSCYYPLQEFRPEYVLNRTCTERLKQGDELLVQIQREALKEKLPAVTTNLSFTGEFLVLTTGNRKLSFSSKLKKAQRELLLPLAETFFDGSFGIVFRTNSGTADTDDIRREFTVLKERMEMICTRGKSRISGSCLWKSEPAYIKSIRNTSFVHLEEVVTDVPEIYKNLKFCLSDKPPLMSLLKKYEDNLLPLYKLHSLEAALEEALHEKVWLSSGGFLVIEQTEAFAVIDVNTGKYSGKKQAEETYLKINLEAAREAARQIRLRQLSGIILIDFINLSEEANRASLLKELRERVAFDTVKTVVVDMTPLQIAELTRQKTRKSLNEQMEEI